MKPRLVLVTDLGLADETATGRVLERVLDAVPPTLVAIGVRDHDVPVRRRLAFSRALSAIVRGRGAQLWVHDRVDVALAVGADGVQLGRRSIDPRQARALLGERTFVSVACHDEVELARAVEGGADAVMVSPLFASPGKGAPLGEARFFALRARAKAMHVIALGGVDATNASKAKACGADGVSVIRALLTASDPGAVARALVSPWLDDAQPR